MEAEVRRQLAEAFKKTDTTVLEQLVKVWIKEALRGRQTLILGMADRLFPAKTELSLESPSWEMMAIAAVGGKPLPEEHREASYGEPDEHGRLPLSPADYLEAKAIMMDKLLRGGYDVRAVGGYRSPAYNAKVGGLPGSKHCVFPGMADDLGVEFDGEIPEVGGTIAQSLESVARAAGLWAVYHDTGSGPHLHHQGLPVGPINGQWLEDWADPAVIAWAHEVYS